jgi:hypothetical protein
VISCANLGTRRTTSIAVQKVLVLSRISHMMQPFTASSPNQPSGAKQRSGQTPLYSCRPCADFKSPAALELPSPPSRSFAVPSPSAATRCTLELYPSTAHLLRETYCHSIYSHPRCPPNRARIWGGVCTQRRPMRMRASPASKTRPVLLTAVLW